MWQQPLTCNECQRTIYGTDWRTEALGLRKVYCDACWAAWSEQRRWGFLDQPLAEAPVYQGLAKRSYGGRLVHVLQIGLGTFGTFVHGDTVWMDMLLDATSWAIRGRREPLLGIGVDALEESAGAVEDLAVRKDALGASVMLAAVGEASGKAQLFCLPPGLRMRVRERLEAQQLEVALRAEVDCALAHLENMSSVGAPHPDFDRSVNVVRRLAGITDQEMTLIREVPVCTFADVLRDHDAGGCEVLVVDAEGADAAILRSVVASCSTGERPLPWPRVVRFETRGHADVKEHEGSEEAVVTQLQSHGYLLLEVSGDVTLVHEPTLRWLPELAQWADDKFTLQCYVCGWKVKPSGQDFAEQSGVGYQQWGGAADDWSDRPQEQWRCTMWCCRWCLATARERGLRTSSDMR